MRRRMLLTSRTGQTMSIAFTDLEEFVFDVQWLMDHRNRIREKYGDPDVRIPSIDDRFA
jgi:hypothetical protein